MVAEEQAFGNASLKEPLLAAHTLDKADQKREKLEAEVQRGPTSRLARPHTWHEKGTARGTNEREGETPTISRGSTGTFLSRRGRKQTSPAPRRDSPIRRTSSRDYSRDRISYDSTNRSSVKSDSHLPHSFGPDEHDSGRYSGHHSGHYRHHGHHEHHDGQKLGLSAFRKHKVKEFFHNHHREHSPSHHHHHHHREHSPSHPYADRHHHHHHPYHHHGSHDRSPKTGPKWHPQMDAADLPDLEICRRNSPPYWEGGKISRKASFSGSSSTSEELEPEDLSAGDLSEHDFDHEDSQSADAEINKDRSHHHPGYHFTTRHKVWLIFQPSRWRHALWSYAARYEAFSMVLLVASIIFNVLESLETSGLPLLHSDAFINYGQYRLETCCCVVFTLEYSLKIWACVESPRYRELHPVRARFKFAVTWGMIFELAVVMMFYADLCMKPNTVRGFQAVRSIRCFRLLAVQSAKNSLWEISVILRRHSSELQSVAFLGMLMLIISSTVMYYVEGDAQPDKFSSIPATMWWGVATLTTVGYGDMVPITDLGRLVGLITMLCGVGLFALPAGILGSAFIEMQRLREKKKNKEAIMEVEDEILEVEDELHDIHEVVEEENRRIESIENSLETLIAEVRDIAASQVTILAHMGLSSSTSATSATVTSPTAGNVGADTGGAPERKKSRRESSKTAAVTGTSGIDMNVASDICTPSDGKAKTVDVAKTKKSARKRVTTASMPPSNEEIAPEKNEDDPDAVHSVSMSRTKSISSPESEPSMPQMLQQPTQIPLGSDF